MSAPNIGIFLRGAKEAEQSSGAILTTIEPWLPMEMFHPWGNYQANYNDTPAPMTKALDTHVLYKNDDGAYEDISILFAPAAYGTISEYDTGLKIKQANGTWIDAREVYAKMGTVPIPLELNKVPKGDFNCVTYLFTYMDTSGSMNSVLPAARGAVDEIRKYFKAIYYGNNDTLAAKYIRAHKNYGNEAWLNWFASSDAGDNVHNAVSIAFINESNSIYHPGHPTGSYNAHKSSYISNYNNWKAGGGTHQAAVMGMGANAWWSVQFSQHVLDSINNDLRDYNVQGFMGLSSGMGSPAFVAMIVDWLNIPQIPTDLACAVTANNDEQSTTTVKWNLQDYICGITGTYDPSASDRFSPTMKGWKIEIANDSGGSNIVQTSNILTTLPDLYSYTPNKLGAKFWLRLTAVGETGFASKSSSWRLCRLKNTAPVVSLNGNASYTMYQTIYFTDPGFTATDDHDPSSALLKQIIYPDGFYNDTSNTTPGTYTLTYKATDTSGASSQITRSITIEAGQLITGIPSYVGFTDLGWNFTQSMQNGNAVPADDGDTTYYYELATQYDANNTNVFSNSVVQTLERASFQTTAVFNNLTPYTTYYARVRVTGDLPGVSNITTQYTDPCLSFSASRADDGDGTSTIQLTTAKPNTKVFVVEDRSGETRGLVRPVANDQFGGLFIASGEGLVQTTSSGAGGKLVFDGGFPKFYDSSYWNASYDDSLTNMFALATPGQWPYMVNCIKYASSQRGSATTNKVLYVNDSSGGSYGINVFDDGIKGCSSIAGKTMSYFKDISTPNAAHKDHILANASKSVSHWRTYFDQFDCIVWFGTSYLTDWTLPANFKQAILDYFDNGGGIFIVTDHNSFQYVVNQIVKPYGIQFTGDFDRTPGNDAYKVSTILSKTALIPQGVHPLFQDMHPDAYIHAGGSEGKIIYDDDPTTGGAFTSEYTSNNAGNLTINAHNNNIALGKYSKLILRTANDCGQVFEPMALPSDEVFTADKSYVHSTNPKNVSGFGCIWNADLAWSVFTRSGQLYICFGYLSTVNHGSSHGPSVKNATAESLDARFAQYGYGNNFNSVFCEYVLLPLSTQNTWVYGNSSKVIFSTGFAYGNSPMTYAASGWSFAARKLSGNRIEVKMTGWNGTGDTGSTQTLAAMNCCWNIVTDRANGTAVSNYIFSYV